jgi:3-hydroxyisobutyrate dehydrogenase-like beta-hydroxyacid dehydrogenase
VTSNTTLGFIGLGKMGQPMALNLLRAGYRLRIYNRTAEKAAPLTAQGAELVAKPAEVAGPGALVVTMVANDQALEEITLGQGGIGEALQRGGIHLSMSTVSPETARRLARYHQQKGAAYVAAPVFGRPEAAAMQKLWICEAGPQAAKESVRPILGALGQGVFDFGEDPPAANVVKLAGNFLIASALEAMGEAMALAEKNGVSRSSFATMIGQTLFACPIYQNYGKMIASQTYEPAGFQLSLGLKDVNLVLGIGTAVNVPMPLASLVRDRMLSSMAQGRQDVDWSGLALRVSEDAGLK